MRRSTATLVLCLLAATACQQTKLDPQELVKGPRVLAIVAEPPDIPPGGTSALSVLYADVPGSTRTTTRTWVACISPDAIGAGGFTGAQFGVAQNGPGCPPVGMGTPPTVMLATDASGGSTLPSDFTSDVLTNLATLAAALGSMADPGALTLIAATTGIPVLVQVTISDATTGEELVTAFKRVLISYHSPPNSNPPPPRFSINGSWVTARMAGTAPFTCVPEDPGNLPTAMPGQQITLGPDPDDATWQESYVVLAPDGSGFLTKTEGSYYAWFSTMGSFDQGGQTQAPTRDEAWTPPAMLPAGTAPDVPIWLVVRDGHGGASACMATVHVE